MPTLVSAPDGKEIEFPDSMDRKAIQSAMQKLYPPKSLSLADTGRQALSNFVPSAMGITKNIGSALLHPETTAKSIGSAFSHPLEALGIPEIRKRILGEKNVPEGKGLSEYLWNRYKNADTIKNTVAHDPVGALLDLSNVVSPMSKGLGELAGPKIASQVSRAASLPADVLSKGTKSVGKGIRNLVSEEVGRASRFGKDTLPEAMKSSPGFLKQFHGGALEERQLVDQIMSKLDARVEERGANYRNALKGIPDHPLDMNPVLESRNRALSEFGVGRDAKTGRLTFDNSSLQGDIGLPTLREADRMVEKAPIEGGNGTVGFQRLVTLHHQLNNLIKKVSIKAAGRSTRSEAFLKGIQSKVDELLHQNPAYSEMARKYAEDTAPIQDLQSAYSLYKGGSLKPQAVLTKIKTIANQPTDFARNILKDLDTSGDLSAQVAGLMAKPWTRQGIGGGAAAIGTGLEAALSLHNPALAAKILPALLATSPRSMAYIAQGAGKAGRGLSGLSRLAATPEGLLLMNLLNIQGQKQ